ncbi:GumC family protein, partial [Gemmatimonadota bacterium]
ETVSPGGTLQLPGATLTLRSEGLPDAFRIRVLDRQDVVDRILRKGLLSAEITGGDLAEVTFTSRDGATAARVANTAVELYLLDRRERMRGISGNRLGVLTHLADSLQGELSRATAEYRRYQEAERAFDPERLGDVERAGELRAEVDAMSVEARALDEVLGRMSSDSVSAADILAYPSFLSSDAINNVLDRIFTLQAERIELLKRRTERDDEVILLQENIDYLKGELVALARSYRDGIQRQLEELAAELQRYREELASRPLEEERTFELEGEVERLTASYLGVQTQLVQARLANIGEGTDLRQIDRAPAPKKPAFPIWWLNLGIGLVAGFFLGLVAALVRGALSPAVRDAAELRRISGLRVVTLDGLNQPLLLKGLGEVSTLTFLPLSGVGDLRPALERALGEAFSKARVADGPQDPGLLEALEGASPVIPAVRAGKTLRAELEDTLEALEVMEARVPGILLLSK